MHQIQLTEEVYNEAKRRADEAGFISVDDYVADMLSHENIVEDTENLDHLFTPERLEHLDRVIAKVKAGGRTYTMQEVRENLAKNRADWMRENGK